MVTSQWDDAIRSGSERCLGLGYLGLEWAISWNLDDFPYFYGN